MSDSTIARTAKGKRPVYFADPATDKLLAIVLALVEELSVSRDRIDTIERMLEEQGLLDRDEIDAYEPDTETRSQRDESRANYIRRVMRIVTAELQETDESGATKSFTANLRQMLEGGD